MSGKKVYQIVKNASEVQKVNRSLDRVPNVFPPPKGRVDKRRIFPIMLTVLVWSTCLPIAYYVWKNKKPEESIETVEVAKPDATVKKPKKSLIALRSYEEMGLKHFDNNVPTTKGLTVTVNEDRERVEILNVSTSSWKLKMVPFRMIERDSNGQLIFDEKGYPVKKPFSIKNLFKNIHENLKEQHR